MERQGARRRGEWLWRRARQHVETDIGVQTDGVEKVSVEKKGVEMDGVEMDGVETDGEGANLL